MDPIRYYDKNATEFYNRTVHADVQELHQKFIKHLPPKGHILDAGCGSGRDAKLFLNQGYNVVPFDGSLEMAKLASNFLEKEVLHLLFKDMHFSNEFDAVWANASLLHTPYEGLREVIGNFHKALLPSGILYASFKYGTSMRQTNGRVFFDMNERSILPYLEGLFHPVEIWKSEDTRSKVAPGPDKTWLNFIARPIHDA
jgi:SAM-dependent methyltransferase